MLSNAYLLAKIRFDTAENEPAKNLQFFFLIASAGHGRRLPEARRERRLPRGDGLRGGLLLREVHDVRILGGHLNKLHLVANV